jgi:hypothetical protein
LRTVGRERRLEIIEYFFRQAERIAGVFTINGGTALINTAFETRLSPCRAKYRATSPPPVE